MPIFGTMHQSYLVNKNGFNLDYNCINRNYKAKLGVLLLAFNVNIRYFVKKNATNGCVFFSDISKHQFSHILRAIQ